MSYIRFGLMILTSTAVMFILMYLNTYAWEHVVRRHIKWDIRAA